jgi:signal transduction histidine kinase
VDGKAVRSLRDLIVADAGIRSFLPFPVEVLRDGRERRVVTITPVFNLARPDWLFSLIFCCALGFTGFYLVLQRPLEPAYVLIALAALFYLVFTAVKPFYYENRTSNLLIHFGKLTSWLMVLFALYFPRPRGTKALRLALLLSIPAVYAVFAAVRLRYFALWSDFGADQWLRRYRFLGQIGNAADGVAFGLYALLLIGTYLRSASAQEKRQIEWILAGFLIAIPPYFFLDQLPIILGEPPGMRISMGSFANLFLAFVPLFFTVGLIKHRVFNLRFFLSRYVVYTLLVFLLLGFFTVFYEPAAGLFMANYGLPDNMAAFLVTTLLYLLLVPLRFGLSTAVDRLFYRKHYIRGTAYSAGLERRNQELQVLIEQLQREGQRSLRQRTFGELRGVLRGLTRRMDVPTRRITGALIEARGELTERPTEPAERSGELAERPAGPAERSPELIERPTEPAHPSPAARERDIRVQRILAEALEDAAEIRELLGRLATIVGPHAAAPTRVSVPRLLAAVRAAALRRHPQLEVRVSSEPRSRAVCHPEEITQLLAHLIENAEEAMGPRDTTVTLRCLEREGHVEIWVEDSGMGFDARAQRLEFEPFFSTKPGHDGLGLYFCRLIAERNLGSIELRRSPEGGGRAVVRLPAAWAPAIEQPPHHSGEPEEPGALPQ